MFEAAKGSYTCCQAQSICEEPCMQIIFLIFSQSVNLEHLVSKLEAAATLS